MLLDVCTYSLYLCPSLDTHKINKQRCDLVKGQGIIIEMRIIIVTQIFAKIKSRVIALAAWRKILKQVNFCDAYELIPPFRHNIFQHIHFQPIVKPIAGKNVIKFMKFYTDVFGYMIPNCQRKCITDAS